PAFVTGVTWTASSSNGATGFTASGSGNTISDTVTMPVNATITYTVAGTLATNASGTLSNTATVTAPATVSDPNSANNTATDSDPITPRADLQITKANGVTFVIAGSVVTY